MRTPLSVGVLGLGRQGLDYANVLAELPQVRLRWLCDERGELPERTAHRFATARLTQEPNDLFEDESLDAVAIMPGGRPALVWCALSADKHVLVGPPLGHSARDAAELVYLAHARGRALVVADPLVTQPAAAKLKQLIGTGGLGETYALYANRQGIAKEMPNANGVWAFGAHELSLLLYLLEDEPIAVEARAEAYTEPDVADVVWCDLRFATGIGAHVHLSWLDPLPVRRLTAIGSERMAVLDELEPARKLTIYPRAAGEVSSPHLEPHDSIRAECERLVAAVRTATPEVAARAVAVASVLESVQNRLGHGAQPIELRPRPDLQVVPLRPA